MKSRNCVVKKYKFLTNFYFNSFENQLNMQLNNFLFEQIGTDNKNDKAAERKKERPKCAVCLDEFEVKGNDAIEYLPCGVIFFKLLHVPIMLCLIINHWSKTFLSFAQCRTGRN